MTKKQNYLTNVFVQMNLLPIDFSNWGQTSVKYRYNGMQAHAYCFQDKLRHGVRSVRIKNLPTDDLDQLNALCENLNSVFGNNRVEFRVRRHTPSYWKTYSGGHKYFIQIVSKGDYPWNLAKEIVLGI